MNPIVLLFTKRFRHPMGAMALFIPLGMVIASLSLWFHPRAATELFLLMVVGLLSWTLLEYFLHRHIFHLTAIREPWRTIASGLHMEHHQDPRSPDLIVAPPMVSLTFGTLVYFFFALCTWSFSAAALLEVGLFLGYLAYEWAHYLAHCRIARNPLEKYLRKYHLQHHYRWPERRYGVTSPLWDVIFGTYSVSRS